MLFYFQFCWKTMGPHIYYANKMISHALPKNIFFVISQTFFIETYQRSSKWNSALTNAINQTPSHTFILIPKNGDKIWVMQYIIYECNCAYGTPLVENGINEMAFQNLRLPRFRFSKCILLWC